MRIEIVAAGLVIGLLVGMTGMGGGALTTPVLILLFKVRPVFAVGTDLVFSAVTKWVGARVHLGHGTVNRALVRQLATGSVPGVLVGLWVLRRLGIDGRADSVVTPLLGAALILIGAAVLIDILRRPRHRGGWVPGARLPTAHPIVNGSIGAVVAFLLAITSVGSGTLIIAALMALYPGLRSAELVGSDVMHAAILVTVAAAGHAALGTIDWQIAGSLLAGSIPGVIVGSRASARMPEHALRPVLATVLLLTGVKLV